LIPSPENGGTNPAERRACTAWTATPLYPGMLGYTLALGAYGIASTRLLTNLHNLLSGHP
jgi:hypothetical protein